MNKNINGINKKDFIKFKGGHLFDIYVQIVYQTGQETKDSTNIKP